MLPLIEGFLGVWDYVKGPPSGLDWGEEASLQCLLWGQHWAWWFNGLRNSLFWPPSKHLEGSVLGLHSNWELLCSWCLAFPSPLWAWQALPRAEPSEGFCGSRTSHFRAGSEGRGIHRSQDYAAPLTHWEAIWWFKRRARATLRG